MVQGAMSHSLNNTEMIASDLSSLLQRRLHCHDDRGVHGVPPVAPRHRAAPHLRAPGLHLLGWRRGLHPHREAQLLPVAPERQLPRLHGHRAPLGRPHRRAVHRAPAADVGHRPDEVGLHRRPGAVRGERGGHGRVVEVPGVPRAPRAAAVRGAPRDRPDVLLGVVQVAEEVDVVHGGDVVDETRVHGAHRVNVPCAEVEHVGHDARGLVHHGAVAVVLDVGGGHER
ncbi:Os08g0452200 [Oryza sativa Japonica Group]|uniref:Os08g0452200 protein n=2 Tax=Oryza sativa subsp. japonica TaxID=39947 RepID=Q0J598_ORYSJ|nr:hypothetical protein EE612_044645 [Oryza sativa]BAD08784.1 unknown protein [Oryza sativa Japonica Group]BAF23867.1 Os08g0452200 [Oryza sativa Japonica Group]BAT05713.1 Os08g0452200 [Oryza sativa Japonica Group]|eukprot:NP_001061953.1 Os08g0452200 [Oryza sativa Japonica Group]